MSDEVDTRKTSRSKYMPDSAEVSDGSMDSKTMSSASGDDKATSGLSPASGLLLAKLNAINEAIKGYDPALRQRAADLLLDTEVSRQPVVPTGTGRVIIPPSPESSAAEATTTFGDLVERWKPGDQPGWVLLSAYYLTKFEGKDTMSGFELNKVLRNHGNGIANIPRAVQRCIDEKPATMLQVKKEGTTQQARKTYRLTTIGLKQVEDHLRGS